LGDASTILLMPQGSNFLLLRQKKSHQRKGDPDDCPDPAMLRKKRNGPKLASLRQRAVLIAFFLRFSGTIHGDPGAGDKNTWIASPRSYIDAITLQQEYLLKISGLQDKHTNHQAHF
jgi:hypothetical protein